MAEQQIFHSVLSLIRQDKQDGAYYEHSTSIYHRANTVKQAATDAARFQENREKAFKDFPYMWGVLGCLKVYAFDINPIAEDGAYQSVGGFCLFEWKNDWGAPLPQYIDAIAT